MQLYKAIFLMMCFSILMQIAVSTARADIQVRNASTTEVAWITYSTWQEADHQWSAGYRTQGWKAIEPGGSLNLSVSADNPLVYLRVQRADQTVMKPADYLRRDVFLFWIHHSEAFTLVETEAGDILESDIGGSDFALAEFYTFANGEQYTIPATHQELIRAIYFLPNDLEPLPNIDADLTQLIKDTEKFFAAEMDRHRYAGKTVTFETDENGQPLIHWFDGLYPDTYYHSDTTNKVLDELATAYDLQQDMHLIFTDVTSEQIGDKGFCGFGMNPDAFTSRLYEHWAIVPAFGECMTNGRALPLVLHELGHAFGLRHDFRSDAYIMSYAPNPDRISECAAQWLNVSKHFNPRHIFTSHPATFQGPFPLLSQPDTMNLRFQAEDLDGIHQARLVLPRTGPDKAGKESLFGCQFLEGATVARVEYPVPLKKLATEKEITFQIIDILGNITSSQYYVPDAIRQLALAAPAAPSKSPVPAETSLFSNYPNPFNPETWIPYQLAEPAEVRVSIYTIDGKLVRTLALGHQLAGIYHDKSRAAYWDGRNEQGERVASGVYFYTLTAGEFTATRKMLTRK